MRKKKCLQCLVTAVLICGYASAYGVRDVADFPENSLTISVLPAYNLIQYNALSRKSTGALDVGFGLSYRYRWNEHWGISLGVNRRIYHGNINLNGLSDSVHMTEEGGEKYFLYLQFQSSEKQEVSCLEPHLKLEYYHEIKPGLEITTGLGLAYGYNTSEKIKKMEGTYKKYAFFYENNNLIDDLPSMNLGEYADFLNPLKGKTFSNPFLALFDLGLRWNLGENWSVLTLVKLQYSITSLKCKNDVFNHHESYSGVVASRGSAVRTLSAGGEIGIQYRFSRPSSSRLGKKSICPAYR